MAEKQESKSIRFGYLKKRIENAVKKINTQTKKKTNFSKYVKDAVEIQLEKDGQ
jgi:Holliday junction resolvasome RuvABC DNA-binding subunit